MDCCTSESTSCSDLDVKIENQTTEPFTVTIFNKNGESNIPTGYFLGPLSSYSETIEQKNFWDFWVDILGDILAIVALFIEPENPLSWVGVTMSELATIQDISESATSFVGTISTTATHKGKCLTYTSYILAKQNYCVLSAGDIQTTMTPFLNADDPENPTFLSNYSFGTVCSKAGSYNESAGCVTFTISNNREDCEDGASMSFFDNQHSSICNVDMNCWEEYEKSKKLVKPYILPNPLPVIPNTMYSCGTRGCQVDLECTSDKPNCYPNRKECENSSCPSKTAPKEEDNGGWYTKQAKDQLIKCQKLKNDGQCWLGLEYEDKYYKKSPCPEVCPLLQNGQDVCDPDLVGVNCLGNYEPGTCQNSSCIVIDTSGKFRCTEKTPTTNCYQNPIKCSPTEYINKISKTASAYGTQFTPLDRYVDQDQAITDCNINPYCKGVVLDRSTNLNLIYTASEIFPTKVSPKNSQLQTALDDNTKNRLYWMFYK